MDHTPFPSFRSASDLVDWIHMRFWSAEAAGARPHFYTVDHDGTGVVEREHMVALRIMPANTTLTTHHDGAHTDDDDHCAVMDIDAWHEYVDWKRRVLPPRMVQRG